MLGWVLLILLPKWRFTRFLANTAVFPIYLALLYAIGIITAIAEGGLGFVRDFGSPEGVVRLLSDPDFALLVWLHVLCFDQAVGHYVYRDNMAHRYVPLPVQSVLLFSHPHVRSVRLLVLSRYTGVPQKAESRDAPSRRIGSIYRHSFPSLKPSVNNAIREPLYGSQTLSIHSNSGTKDNGNKWRYILYFCITD